MGARAMSIEASGTTVIRYLRTQAGEAGADGGLLARYVQGRGEAAFAALVQRYGGVGLGGGRGGVGGGGGGAGGSLLAGVFPAPGGRTPAGERPPPPPG